MLLQEEKETNKWKRDGCKVKLEWAGRWVQREPRGKVEYPQAVALHSQYSNESNKTQYQINDFGTN